MNKTNTLIFANRSGLAAQICSWTGPRFTDRPFCMVCVSDNATPANPAWGPALIGADFSRALIIFEARPVNLEILGQWREWAIKQGAMELHMVPLGQVFTETNITALVERYCKEWFSPLPPRETPAVEYGKWIELPTDGTDKDDPSHLTMMFGSMGELLTSLDIAGRRFLSACDLQTTEAKLKQRSQYLKEIDQSLAGEDSDSGSAELSLPEQIDYLPRILLRGETGVGKTLIARYLHRRSGFTDGRPLRISIPEYLGKEDMFEYDLFGYAKGAYTDAGDEGSHGLLLHNVGGVVFFDEIGEANSVLQTKLLAYLDDYSVRPRKWNGKPFYCPTLVVAATNQPLEEMTASGLFRKELLARFTDQQTIPALRDRVSDLPFILDCLLQRESMNPGESVDKIKEIGDKALRFLTRHGFKDGNFRELETIFRIACQRTRRERRKYLVESDFSSAVCRLRNHGDQTPTTE